MDKEKAKRTEIAISVHFASIIAISVRRTRKRPCRQERGRAKANSNVDFAFSVFPDGVDLCS